MERINLNHPLRHGQDEFAPGTEWYKCGASLLNIKGAMVYRVWYDGLVAETNYEAAIVRQIGERVEVKI